MGQRYESEREKSAGLKGSLSGGHICWLFVGFTGAVDLGSSGGSLIASLASNCNIRRYCIP